jgi:hypothetical protein
MAILQMCMSQSGRTCWQCRSHWNFTSKPVRQYISIHTNCMCGRTDHLLAMYWNAIPCCNRLHLGARRPKIDSPPRIACSGIENEFSLVSYKRPRKPEVLGSKWITFWSRWSYFLHTKHKIDDIIKRIKANFPLSDQITSFVLRILLTVIISIARRLREFGREIWLS